MEDKRKFMDFVKKLASRKLLVFIVATVLLVLGKIGEDIWLYVSLGYMGVNAAIAAIDSYKTVKAKVEAKTSKLEEISTEEGEA